MAGEWGAWSDWSECSSTCGGGTRKRARLCNNPRPKHGGTPCSGCDEQHEDCSGTSRCSSLQEFSTWSPWVVLSEDLPATDGVRQQRYRVQCEATFSPAQLTANTRTEERVCSSAGVCHLNVPTEGTSERRPPWDDWTLASDDDEGSGGPWEPWSDWSACDRECGTGQQSRWRVCANDDCQGQSSQQRPCNKHSCRGTHTKIMLP